MYNPRNLEAGTFDFPHERGDTEKDIIVTLKPRATEKRFIFICPLDFPKASVISYSIYHRNATHTHVG